MSVGTIKHVLVLPDREHGVCKHDFKVLEFIILSAKAQGEKKPTGMQDPLSLSRAGITGEGPFVIHNLGFNQHYACVELHSYKPAPILEGLS